MADPDSPDDVGVLGSPFDLCRRLDIDAGVETCCTIPPAAGNAF